MNFLNAPCIIIIMVFLTCNKQTNSCNTA